MAIADEEPRKIKVDKLPLARPKNEVDAGELRVVAKGTPAVGIGLDKPPGKLDSSDWLSRVAVESSTASDTIEPSSTRIVGR